eukprot:CAMPEP_0184493172 /NCGR_PEP_ID=MMETSP0113_2-20130426/25312_1 /TAXON_ID=91329 /ORGANISM="Norrisiella sphaerica, Strain BC52" /LENGTH=141 /DNA_ID=CAMNT_0026878349 /DNA_START=1 /DNA_END=426 /DNA_ORIENTATION=+
MVCYENSTNTSKTIKFAVSPRDAYIAYPDRQTVKIFDLESGKLTQNLNGHFDSPTCCVFRDNGTPELFSGGTDRSILKWCPGKEDQRVRAVWEQEMNRQENLMRRGCSRLDLKRRDIDDWSATDEEVTLGDLSSPSNSATV